MQSGRVLVVDDDSMVLRSIKRLLAQQYDVVTSQKPTEALVRATPFDAVVADYCMPELDGAQFLELVHSAQPRSARVLMSGVAYLPPSVTCELQGVLRKPFTATTLSSALADAMASPSRGACTASTPRLPAEQARVLIVDDSDTAIEATQLALEEAGYVGIGLSTPFRLVEFLRREQPVAVLLDVSMPALNGPQLVGVMRQFGYLGRAKVLLHSSASEGELQQHTRDCGADGFIRKTADPDSYRRTLSALLR